MQHIRPLTTRPAPAQTSVWEQAILFVFQLLFSGWDNFDSVFQNLSKFYGKTP